MKRNNAKNIIYLILILAALFLTVYRTVQVFSVPVEKPLTTELGGGDGTISSLDQWKSDGTNITQKTASKPIKLTGLESLSCLGTNGSGIVGAGTCTGGSGGSFPFTAFPSYNATGTAIGFLAGLFSNSSTTLAGLKLTGLSAGGLYLGSDGVIVRSAATSTLTTISGILPTVSGGTGLSNPGSLSAGAILNFNGSGGATAVSVGVAGTVLVSNGSDWVSGSVPGSFAWPWTVTTNFNQSTQSTTTAAWFRGQPISLMSSTTAQFDRINVGSTTSGNLATSTFLGNVYIGDGTNYGFVTGAQPFEVVGTVNLPFQTIVANKSTGGNALAGYTLGNSNTTNTANPFADVYYAGMYLAGSGFNLYPGLQPNDLVLVNSDSAINIASLSTTSPAINFAVGAGYTMGNYDVTVRPSSASSGIGYVGISTTSPKWPLSIYATTTPQLSLGGNITDNLWTQRSIGNNFYMATASPTTYATTSNAFSPFWISNNGTTTLTGLNIIGSATSTSNIGFNITAGCYAFNGVCISGSGSGTVGSGTIGQFPYYAANGTALTATSSIFLATSGNVGIGTTTPQVRLDVLGNQIKLSPVAYSSAAYSSASAGYIVVDKSQTASDASLVLRDQGNARMEFGLVTDNDVHLKTVTGTYPTETFADRMLWRTSGNVDVVGLGLLRNFSATGAPTIIAGNSDGSSTGAGLEMLYDQTGTAATIRSIERGNTYRPFNLEGNYFAFKTGGGTIAEIMRITPNGQVGIGTTTPSFLLTLSSSTAPQLSLSAGAGLAQWVFRNTGDTLTLSTTTIAGNSTTTIPAVAFSKGQILIPDGTGAAPSLSFLDDSNNGIGSPANDIFAIYTNGLERMRFDDGTGAAAMGTTTPGKAILTIGTSTAPQLVLSDNTAGDAQWTMRNAGGNLYLSTTTVSGLSTSTPAFTINNTGYGVFLGGTTTNAGVTGVGINGKSFWTGLTSSAGLQTGILCLSATNEVINESVACVASSRRFKESINYDPTYGLDELMKLKPVSFYWKPSYNGDLQSNPNFSGEQVGFIAEDVADIDSRLVVVETAGEHMGEPHSVRYENITALLVKAVQEQQAQIKNIKHTAQDNWQWIAIGLLVFWNLYLTFRKRK